MKKNLIVLLFALSSSLFTFCKAQQEPGQIVINAGVGYSPEFNGDMGDGLSGNKLYPVATFIETLPNYGSDFPPTFKCSSITPNIGGTIDFGLTKAFSIGVGASNQSEIVSWAAQENNGAPFPFSDKIRRTNAAFRFLYHFPLNNKYVDLYVGIRPGVSLWYDAPSPNNLYNGSSKPPVSFISNPNSYVGSFQVLCGIRIYVCDFVGVHIEGGIGSPYLIEGGLTFRINTHKASDDSTDKKKN